MRVPPDRIVAKEDGPFTKEGDRAGQRDFGFGQRDRIRAIQDQDRGLLIGRRTFGKDSSNGSSRYRTARRCG